jgi:hypothetical protein
MTINLKTYKGSISNIKSCRVTTSHNTQENMQRDKIDDECVASPRTNLKGEIQ